MQWKYSVSSCTILSDTTNAQQFTQQMLNNLQWNMLKITCISAYTKQQSLSQVMHHNFSFLKTISHYATNYHQRLKSRQIPKFPTLWNKISLYPTCVRTNWPRNIQQFANELKLRPWKMNYIGALENKPSILWNCHICKCTPKKDIVNLRISSVILNF